MKKTKKILTLGLVSTIILGSLTPILATVNEKQTTNTSETLATDVLYNQDSSFIVTIPKLITLDNSKTSEYEVTVTGDISSNEQVKVVPESTFKMKDQSTINQKEDVDAAVQQDKIAWNFNEFETLGKGNIEALKLTAGNWKGSFWFNISLQPMYFIGVDAKDETGNNLNASATVITGEEKDKLFESLEASGLVESLEDVDAIINVESDDFDGLAETTFDVNNIAKPNDKVTILHFDEEKGEWEYIGTETVDENGKITADFSSYSPVVFVKVTEDGTYENVEIVLDFVLTSANYSQTGLKKKGYVIIPETFNYNGQKYRIVEIGAKTFYNCTDLEGVSIPSSVTKIGEEAFYNSGLSYITQMGENVTEIGRCAFYNCTNLTDVTIPGSVEKVGDMAFFYCSSLGYVTIQEGAKVIGNNMFTRCENLTRVTIPSTVTTIGNSAFMFCSNLSNMTIPAGVESIGYGIFSNCTGLSRVTFSDTSTWYVGSSAGATTTQVSVTNATTNATNFTSTYANNYWTKK